MLRPRALVSLLFLSVLLLWCSTSESTRRGKFTRTLVEILREKLNRKADGTGKKDGGGNRGKGGPHGGAKRKDLDQAPKKIEGFTDAMKYLEHFENLQLSHSFDSNALRDDAKKVKESLEKLQKLGGIKVTGKLDADTYKLMRTPRCGNRDFQQTLAVNKKRFTLGSSKWGKSEITYKFINFTPDLPRAVILGDVEKAFRLWADVSSLTFRLIEGSEEADIEIVFVETGYHSLKPGEESNDDFSGPGGVLAHAFYPMEGVGGDAHFDESEDWTSGENNGINLLIVAAHEFGHSLGLDHTSSDPSALMAPFYAGYQPNFQLRQDDIDGIQAHYGPPPAATEAPTAPPDQTTPEAVTAAPATPAPTQPPPTQAPATQPPATQAPTPDFCHRPMISAGFADHDQDVFYLFEKGDVYLRTPMSGGALQDVQSGPIEELFVHGPTHVDAAIYIKGDDGMFNLGFDLIWLFDGDNVFLYDNNFDFYYEARIEDEFPGIPGNIDAVVASPSSGALYFFKGPDYWKFVDWEVATWTDWYGYQRHYPRPITDWLDNLPVPHVGATVRWDEDIYFFFGDKWVFYDPDEYFNKKTEMHDVSIYWLWCPAED